jgi:hypothetical protein
MGEKDEARTACRNGLARFPDDTELLLEEAFIHLDAKDFLKAEINLLQLVESNPAPYFSSSDDGVRGFLTRHLLGGQYHDRNRTSEAEVQWRASMLECPTFLPAWLALGELYLKQKRWASLNRLTQDMEKDSGAILDAAIFRARGFFGRQEYSAVPPGLRSDFGASFPELSNLFHHAA